jgi:hypothetical protein
MEPIRINFKGETPYRVLQLQGWDDLTLEVQTDCSYLSGDSERLAYSNVQEQPEGGFLGRCERPGSSHTLSDNWLPAGEGKVRLARQLRVSATRILSRPADGLQLHLGFRLASSASDWRFFAPGMLYSPSQFTGERLATFSDHRLAYPVVMAYQRSTGRAICASRAKTATFDNGSLRPNKEQRYLQKTDIGAVGFGVDRSTIALHLFWPYYEGERSALLNASGSSASAYYPLQDSTEVLLQYEIFMFGAGSFADAVLTAFKNAYELANPQPARLPFSLEDSIAYRLASLQKTYREWADGGAGFLINFDPERGYDSQAKAFGASFTTHDTNDSHSILEYGFTGRQLNAAYMLAERVDGEWRARGRRVVDFFVNRLATESGWMYTLYHLDKARPVYTVGDPQGPVMHYLAMSPQPGNYTRMMVEAARDLLLNYRFHRHHGAAQKLWLLVCVRFADFLVRCQNSDGSWYRAYTPAGDPVRSGAWFGTTEDEAKSATCIPVPFLLALAEEMGDRSELYRAAAEKAGEYVLRQQVAFDEYRGGTLDNPNVVDKEAALLSMTALLNLYEQSGRDAYLVGAERTGKLAVTWNSIWNVPLVPGTRLAGAHVQSTGWGGINSIWGAGVTDIYSLFFLTEFVRLSRLTGEPLYEKVAELVAHGTQQILANPGGLCGFTDIGMQPEGIAFCDQGADDGLIAKGDIWGGLGWIYTAGTYGLSRYLQERDHKRHRPGCG